MIKEFKPVDIIQLNNEDEKIWVCKCGEYNKIKEVKFCRCGRKNIYKRYPKPKFTFFYDPEKLSKFWKTLTRKEKANYFKKQNS